MTKVIYTNFARKLSFIINMIGLLVVHLIQKMFIKTILFSLPRDTYEIIRFALAKANKKMKKELHYLKRKTA